MGNLRGARVTVAVWLAVGLGLGACGGGDDGGGGGAPDAGLPAEIRPTKRSELAGALDPATGRIAIFGGDDGPIVDQIPQPRFLAETWILDPDAGWTEVAGDGPSARARMGVGFDPAGHRMLVFGGRFRAATSGDYTLFDELWSFDLEAGAWTLLDDGQDTGPDGRELPTAAYDPDSETFYVWGGDSDPGALGLSLPQELWGWTAAGGWQEIATTGTRPSTRHFWAYTFDPSRRRLVVFGGQVGDFVSPALRDLHALDLTTMTWSQLHDGTGAAPPGRFSAMLAYDAAGDRYVLTGGHADPGVVNDVWAFDPEAGSWTELAAGDVFTGGDLGCLGNPREIPADYVTEDLTAPERRSGALFAIADGVAWLFGGESDCSDHLDDTWSLDLARVSWSELIEARSGESCARRADACECLCL